MQPFWVKRVVLPLKSIVKRERTREVLADLNASQWLPAAQLRELQTRRLRQLLVQVSRQVPFYREHMRAVGALPEIDDPWQVLRTLPLIDKSRYRAAGKSLASEQAKRAPLVAHTSGTTGERLEINVDRNAAAYMYLSGMRGRAWWGVDMGDPELKIWGSGFGTSRSWKDSAKAVLRSVKDRAMGVTLVSPFFRTDADFEDAVRKLYKCKPKLVMGYANSLWLLADYMERHGHQAGPGWPKAVVYTSEMLTPSQADTLARVFRSPLVAEYGSCEAGVMAYQCPEGKLHVSDDVCIVELLRDGAEVAPGEVGEVVVTALLATEYPLIRYQQGDLACRDVTGCPCGRSLSLLSGLIGRKNDVLFSPSGRIIDFIVFDQLMKDQPDLKRFKVVERNPGDIVVLFETYDGRPWKEADQAMFFARARTLLPADVTVSGRRVGRLAQEPSGKFRIVVRQDEAEAFLKTME